MEIYEIWMEKEEYERRFDYLLYAFDSIEAEVFKSFDINPLRKENLQVSSIFYADICVRLYPCMTIGFNLLTFGFGMQQQINIIRQFSEEEKLNPKIDLVDLESSLIKLKEKNMKNKDTLRDYYKLYAGDDLSNSMYFSLDQNTTASFNVGKIEYDEEIYPFIKKNWYKYLEVRNSIEHRGGIESTLFNSVNALAAVYLMLRRLCFTSPIFRQLSSRIFGGYVVGKIPLYLSPFDMVMNMFRRF